MRLIKYVLLVTVAGALVVAGIGCGTSSTNNQGVSFTLLGFFSELPEPGTTDLPTGELGQAVPISAENPETQSGNLVGTVSTVVGLKNNISSQFVRVDRLLMSYFIEGASRQPPDTTIAFSLFLGPATGGSSSDSGGDVATDDSSSSTGSTSGGSSLPDFSEIVSLSFGSFPIVPPEIIAWINLNRAQLPELPFTMTATVTASGVSSSGQRYHSNEGTYFIIMTPDNEIAPTAGSVSSSASTGTGGTTVP